MNHKVLIVCYFFPPSPGIGGRRSAKFAKYLAKKGDEVFVIQAKNPFPSTSFWHKDISENKNISSYELALNYPVEFIIPPTGFIGKIRYRLYNYYFNLFHFTKNRFDYSFFWNEAYLQKAEELIRIHGIKNMMISGPPFYYAHKAVQLKDKFPELNIIIDFRDPWIGSPYYGMSNLKKKQQDHEVRLINEVFRKANYFTGPNTFLLDKQKSFIYPENQTGANLVEIPHAFDNDEMKELENIGPDKMDGKIRLVYGGQLYPGTGNILEAFNSFLDKLKETKADLYSRLLVEFYTPQIHYKSQFINHPETVHFHPSVGNEIMTKISHATFCLIFLADHNKDFKTTKFLEYSILRKPFIVLGEKGHVAEFVETNSLGKAYDTETIDQLEDLLENSKDYIDKQFNMTFDLSEFSFEKITERLRAILV